MLFIFLSFLFVLTNLNSRFTGQAFEKVANDYQRDFYLTAPEAAVYGVIDSVLMPNQPIKVIIVPINIIVCVLLYLFMVLFHVLILAYASSR